ncbi:hypothetical protein H0A73_17330 [Alcaligenaceae bacterium]|nr:hypothetical protein [Alcaligenaceae bacterium]
MTKRRSISTSWRGALFNALTATQGGIAGFCAWAFAMRGRRIAESTLYGRLDGSRPGERVPIEDAELIAEYVRADAGAKDMAVDWLRALAARFGLVVLEVGELPPGGCRKTDIDRLIAKCVELFERGGRVSGAISRSTADGDISSLESDEIITAIDEGIELLLRARALVLRTQEGDQ